MRLIYIAVAAGMPAIPAKAQESVWLSYHEAGVKEFNSGNYEQALNFLNLALKAGKAQGSQNRLMVSTRYNLGLTLLKLHRYDDAIPHLQKAGDLARDILPTYDELCMSIASVMEQCYVNTDRYADAMPFLVWLTEAIDTTETKQHLLPHTLYDLGLTQKAIGKLEDAEKAFRRALKLREAQGKEGLGAVADVLRQLGYVKVKRRDDDAAFLFFEQAAKKEQRKKEWISFFLLSYQGMIDVRKRQKKSDEVAKLHAHLEKILTEAGADGRLSLATYLYDRARESYREKKYPAAEDFARRAIETYKKAAKDKTALAKGYALLGRLLRQIGKPADGDKAYEEAEKLFRRVLLDRENALGPDHPDLVTALSALAAFLSETGKYDEAEKLLKRALANREKAFGTNHRLVGHSLDDLADFYHELGRQTEAEPLYKRAIDIFAATYGLTSVSMAMTFNSLAWVYIRQRRYDEGVPLARQSITIRETIGSSPGQLARSVNTLGCLLSDLCRYEEAEPLLNKALQLYEQAEQSDQSDIPAVLNNLGNIAEATDRYEDAVALYERSIALKEKAGIAPGGTVSERLNRAGNLARSGSNLAGVLSTLGRTVDAESHAKKALEIREEYLGKDHPTVADSLRQLGWPAAQRGEFAKREALFAGASALRSKIYPAGAFELSANLIQDAALHWYYRRLDDAEAAYRKVEAMYEKHYGGDPKFLAWIWKDRGNLAVAQGKYDEAAPLLRKALAHYEKEFPGSTSYAAALVYMADLDIVRGDYESADKRIEAARKIYAKVYGTDHRNFRFMVARQAEWNVRAGRYSDAHTMYEKLLAAWEKDAASSPEFLAALHNVGRMDVLEGRTTVALEKCTRCLRLAEKFHGPNPYHIARFLATRADALFRSGKPADAETPARQVYDAYTKALGSEHPSTALAALQLGRVFVALGKTDAAEPLITKAKAFRDKLYPAEHPETALTRQAEAEPAVARGKSAVAAKLYAAALKSRDAKYAPDHPETLRLLSGYAKVLEKAGSVDEFKIVQRRLERTKPSKSP